MSVCVSTLGVEVCIRIMKGCVGMRGCVIMIGVSVPVYITVHSSDVGSLPTAASLEGKP